MHWRYLQIWCHVERQFLSSHINDAAQSCYKHKHSCAAHQKKKQMFSGCTWTWQPSVWTSVQLISLTAVQHTGFILFSHVDLNTSKDSAGFTVNAPLTDIQKGDHMTCVSFQVTDTGLRSQTTSPGHTGPVWSGFMLHTHFCAVRVAGYDYFDNQLTANQLISPRWRFVRQTQRDSVDYHRTPGSQTQEQDREFSQFSK